MDISVASYQSALDYLFERTTGPVKFGLERTLALSQALGDPHRAVPVIHLAGTNGKGSCVATAEALLAGRGLRVARYTSPHLVDFRERMVAAGVPIPADDVVEFVSRHTPLVERLGATFFEATTVMAFDYFARAGVDVALIEAGLGGRLDSTNIVDPLAAGVVSIGYDHMEYLGDSLSAIAAEKAGIFKEGRPAVVGEQDPAVRSELAAHARARGASSVTVVADEYPVSEIRVDDTGTSFVLRHGSELRPLRTPLVGRHQAANVACTLAVLAAAGEPYSVSLEEAAVSLDQVVIPGRFQHVGAYIFDVAHNADGAAVLAQSVEAVGPARPITAVLCVLRDKEWPQMMRALRPVIDRFVLTDAPTAPASRAWDLAEVARFAAAEGMPADAVPDFDEALARARAGAATVLVTGSFHTVGDAMARLQVAPLVR